MAAKQLEGFFLFEWFLGEFCGITRIFERRRGERSSSQSVTLKCVAVSSSLSSQLFPHWLPICLLYPQETTATANNLLSPRYPPIKKKNGKLNRFCVKKKKKKWWSSCCCNYSALVLHLNRAGKCFFSAGHFHPWPSLEQDNHEREFFFPGCWIH